jgi:hypothetical protein
MNQHVQRVDFILTLSQVIEMIADRDTTAIRISMGITEAATIEFFAEGVKYETATGDIRSSSGIQILCPVPPDCPRNANCRQKFQQLLNPAVSSAILFNFQ